MLDIIHQRKHLRRRMRHQHAFFNHLHPSLAYRLRCPIPGWEIVSIGKNRKFNKIRRALPGLILASRQSAVFSWLWQAGCF
ncbi:hypothetical protein JOS77_20170 [Chromobacterium haemolyticum]|nr:hypothetical protein JOS77_20170 [Chromobacterium haemolyticum]